MKYQVFVICLCILIASEIRGSCIFKQLVKGYRILKSAEGDTIFAKPAETVDLVCENDMPLARCGFTHPNGTKILFQNLLPGTPSCKYATEATRSDLGVWTCHFWSQTSPQDELKKTIALRVAYKFAAVEREVRVREGEEVSLSCISTEIMVPLNYCYFMTPERKRIHMDDGVTSQSPLMEKYYFPHNKSVHRGDCGITIKSAAVSDSGAWSCCGWLESEDRQFSDTIRLIVDGEVSAEAVIADEPLAISVPGYVCGTVAFLGMFATLVYYKYRHYSRYHGKTFGDDDSIARYHMERHDNAPLVVTSDYLLIT